MSFRKNLIGFEEFTQKLSSACWTWSSVKSCSSTGVSELLKWDFFWPNLSGPKADLHSRGDNSQFISREKPPSVIGMVGGVTCNPMRGQTPSPPHHSSFSEGKGWNGGKSKFQPSGTEFQLIPSPESIQKFTQKFTLTLMAGAPDGFPRQDLGICCSVWPKQLLFPSSITTKSLTTNGFRQWFCARTWLRI